MLCFNRSNLTKQLSQLSRTNAELNRNITLLRAERLSLKGAQFQLECENASLRTRLEQAQDRERELINQLESLQSTANLTGKDGWSGTSNEEIEVGWLIERPCCTVHDPSS